MMPTATKGVRPPTDPPARRARGLAFSAACLSVALLLLQRPYHGIWHDSVLYLGQALAVLHPEVFRQDLFFAYGSQSSYSLVQYVVAPLVERLGSSASFMGLALLGLGLFLLSSWRLLTTVLPTPELAYAGLLALIVFPGSYGAWNSLSYAESFFTGRSLAEPLALLGMAAVMRARTMPGVALLVLGAAFNPLQALPVIAAAWTWLALGDRRWLHAAWMGLIAVMSAPWLPLTPGLFTRMDPAWFGQVWERNLVVFYSHSQAGDWYYLLTDAVLLVLTARRAAAPLRRFVVAIGLACGVLITASLAFADLAHLAWPAGLQLWRAHWLLHWTALACLPWLILYAWQARGERTWLLLLLALVAMGTTPANAHPLVPGIALLLLAWPWLERHLSIPMRLSVAMMCLAIAVWHLFEVWAIREQSRYWLPLLQWPSPLLHSWLPVLVPLLAIATPLYWLRAGPRGRNMLVVGAAALAIAAVLQWDHRTAINRAFTATAPVNPFGSEVPRDSQVVWIGGLLPTWNILRRAHYIDQQQLAGIVFNRGTAAEGFRRRELLHVTDGTGRDCRIVTFPLEAHPTCKPDLVALRRACTRTRGELDYFVLPYRLPMAPLGAWSPLGSGEPGYHLYACRDLVATMGATPAAGYAGPR